MSSKRFKKLPEKTKNLNAESIEKLLPIIKKNCTTKFDESLDLSFQINNKQKNRKTNMVHRTYIFSKKIDFLNPILTNIIFSQGESIFSCIF